MEGFELFLTVVQCVIGAGLISENVLLSIIIITTPELHVPKYIFTGSLAVADILVGIVAFIELRFNLVDEAKSEESLFGTIFATLAFVIFLHALIHMTVIAIERYLYVVRPFFYERWVTSRLIRLLIAGIWTFSLFFEILLVLIHISVLEVYVTTLRSINQTVKLVCVGVFHLSITIVTCLCYALILCQVRKHTRAVGAQDATTKEGASKTKDVIKSVKFFLMMFGFFFFMTTPVMYVESLPEVFNLSQDVRFLLIAAAVSNSGINFIILNVFDNFFRGVAKKRLLNFQRRFFPSCHQ